MSRRSPAISRLVVIGAAAAAFALSGCGRKGPLELPPSATAPQPAQAAAPGINPMAQHPKPAATPSAFDSEGRPIAPKGAKKPLPMDWLID